MASDEVPIEIAFAQKLAANEKVSRDRALRKLQKYLHNRSTSPSGGLDETELLKIWKGLHYCMWMQDKPLVQEELSANVANLIHSFGNRQTALLFIKTFYITECREWLSIDKWRVDKFLMLFRNMLTQSFVFLSNQNWSEKLARAYLGFLTDYMLTDDGHVHCPDGVKFHLADIYLTELAAVSKGKLGPKQTVAFLQPWITMLVNLKNLTLRAHVIKNVFGELLQQSPVLSRKSRTKDSTELRVNYKLLADKLLEAGSQELCTSVNRPVIYRLVENFRDVAEGKLPFSPEDQVVDDVNDLNEDDVEAAVQRLAAFEEEFDQEKLQGKKAKKRKLESSDDLVEREPSQSDTGAGDSVAPPKKQKALVSKSAKKSKSEDGKSKILSKRLKQLIDLDQQLVVEQNDEVDSDEAEYSLDDGGCDDGDALSSDPEIPHTKQGAEPEKPAVEKKSKRQRRKNKSALSKPGAGTQLEIPQGKQEARVVANGAAPINGAADDNAGHGSKLPKAGKVTKGTKPQASKKPTPHGKASGDFEVAEFSDSEDLYGLPADSTAEAAVLDVKPAPKDGLKTKNATKKVAPTQPLPKSLPTDKVQKTGSPTKIAGSAKLADFASSGETKAKYFQKAMSKSVLEPSAKSSKTRESEKRRISFGESRSVKKTEVKLKGSLSYDPNKTPEQSILKVNPIQPGTVIQVGKQATLRNTLKNSKFPQRMMASSFF